KPTFKKSRIPRTPAGNPIRTDETRRPDQTSKQIMSRYNYVLYRLANSVLPFPRTPCFVPIYPSVAALPPPPSRILHPGPSTRIRLQGRPISNHLLYDFSDDDLANNHLIALVNVAASPSNVVGCEPLIFLGNCQQRAPTIVAFLDRRQTYFCCTSTNGPLDCIWMAVATGSLRNTLKPPATDLLNNSAI
ncbi:uncharacterized protein CCOS01_02734, partial [Colletotrichum costaricense]